MREIIQQVILIILVGTILDMLMPNGRLQNLVRLVVGLFIMVAILNPIMSFMHHQDWSQTLSQQALPEEITSGYEEIKRQGEGLRQQNYERAREEARFRLERQVEALASLKSGIKDAKAQIKLDGDDQKGIYEIRLHLSEESGSLFVPNQVAEVQIDPVGSTESTDSREPREAIESTEATTTMPSDEQVRAKEKNDLAAQLAQTLSGLYGVPIEKIQVTWD
ncbi:stage III sporulation protein AF [Heliorestis acidaminivorans]|uniref:stage III sporulation protein AF n=1 Tax=Heliorestis acidaminivorans TaxID=553427 RepID=UPI001478F6D0|nr:stage III sporulation protein AF [Heliorestis acidaminivorans]